MLKKEFLTGNEVVVRAALKSGAQMMFAYPITPSTEITERWAEEAEKNPRIQFIQTEDETSAGFGVIGAILGGKKAFTASAGPGNVLLQDPISAAEAMRLPFVGIIMQRGGPSTGTVIYSQQEVNLTCFGGNTEGLRFVYSPANLQELYDLTIKTFNMAWKYRFPGFLLSDGYLAKMKGEVVLKEPEYIIKTKYVLGDEKKIVNLRNTYSMEEELYEVLEKDLREYKRISKKVIEYEGFRLSGASEVIFAHGTVAEAAKEAINELKNKEERIGLFRPITLRPFPEREARNIAKRIKKIFIIESSAGQFSRLCKEALKGEEIEIKEELRPALGITPEEIINVTKMF